MSWIGRQNKKRVERTVGDDRRSKMDSDDSVCTFCGSSYDIEQEGGHHFPACDVRGCGSLGHSGCQHR